MDIAVALNDGKLRAQCFFISKFGALIHAATGAMKWWQAGTTHEDKSIKPDTVKIISNLRMRRSEVLSILESNGEMLLEVLFKPRQEDTIHNGWHSSLLDDSDLVMKSKVESTQTAINNFLQEVYKFWNEQMASLCKNVESWIPAWEPHEKTLLDQDEKSKQVVNALLGNESYMNLSGV